MKIKTYNKITIDHNGVDIDITDSHEIITSLVEKFGVNTILWSIDIQSIEKYLEDAVLLEAK